MKLKAFAVFDKKAAAYLQPFFMLTRGQAVRSFGDAINDGEHQMAKHAADYVLYDVGCFDQENGVFETQAPVILVEGASLQQRGEEAVRMVK